jgi:hypothetical protein
LTIPSGFTTRDLILFVSFPAFEKTYHVSHANQYRTNDKLFQSKPRAAKNTNWDTSADKGPHAFFQWLQLTIPSGFTT